MGVLPLRKASPPPPSEARRRLAERIAERDADATRLASLRDIVDRGNDNVRVAREARDAAAASVANAGAIDRRAATDALIAGTPQPRPTSAAAHAMLDEAEAVLASAIFARDSVHAEIADLDKRAWLREQNVRDAAAAVMREEGADAITGLIAELEGLNKALADKAIAILALIRAGIVRDRGEGATPGLMELTVRFTNMSMGWPWIARPEASPTGRAWEAALAALMTDAAAPVPK